MSRFSVEKSRADNLTAAEIADEKARAEKAEREAAAREAATREAAVKNMTK